MRRVILLSEGTSSYARGLLHGIAEYSRHHGPWTFYRESMVPFYRASRQKKTLACLKSWNADGIIARVKEPELLNDLISFGRPIITVDDNNQQPHCSKVISDYQATAKIAAEHLLSLGLRHFAFCGFDSLLWSRKRCHSYCTFLEKSGFSPQLYKSPRSKTGTLWENEQSRIISWLKSLPKPVGIMACNDDRGQQIIDCCKIANIHVPEQVAIIGVDNDILLCNLSNPPLSSVAINTTRAGYLTAQLLHKLMDGEKSLSHTVVAPATHVEIRQSTETLAIEDKDVAEAIRYIRQNARQKIQASDVAHVVALSRRTLLDKFKRSLGHTVHDEIKRVRIQQISRILIETDLPVYMIARSFHFTCGEHIARYFRQATGMSPQFYRKQFGRVDCFKPHKQGFKNYAWFAPEYEP